MSTFGYPSAGNAGTIPGARIGVGVAVGVAVEVAVTVGDKGAVGVIVAVAVAVGDGKTVDVAVANGEIAAAGSCIVMVQPHSSKAARITRHLFIFCLLGDIGLEKMVSTSFKRNQLLSLKSSFPSCLPIGATNEDYENGIVHCCELLSIRNLPTEQSVVHSFVHHSASVIKN